ncbi:hypothetical protein OG612_45935 (plasmid) [Streptomyces sp. NBC_01527]|uniref:hypothetical protein n=1 Tax=Streptomyces sp. NBC_01527 TaxID=2903894 RepID=UPI00386B9E8D
MRFEITDLDADDDHVTHTADATEVGALVAWTGRHGVRVRVRRHSPAAEPAGGTGVGQTQGGTR